MMSLSAVGVAVLAAAVMAVPGSAENAAPRPAAFANCAVCHATEAGKTSYGPNLHGVAGRKAASQSDYAFSASLRGSRLTWDRTTLDSWLASPQKMVPGTKMSFAGIPDPAKRKQVIEYLVTLK
ncbi:c-type cytochrome [Novosphingobium lindaniclasticum]